MLRDAALLVRGHVDADDPIQQRRLAVVDVAEDRDDRRAGLQGGGVVFLLLRFEHLVFQAEFAANLDLNAQFRGQQFGHLGIEIGGDVAHDAQAQELAENGPGRHADGLGERADITGERDDHFALAGRGGIGSGAADVGPAVGGGRGGNGRGIFFFAGDASFDGGRPLPFELALFAAAQGAESGAAAFGPFLFHAAGTSRRPPRTVLAAQRQVTDGDQGFFGRARFARAAPLGRQVVALLLLFVFLDVLGERLRARLARTNRVQRQLDVRLLRGRLLRLRSRRSLRRGRHWGQVRHRRGLVTRLLVAGLLFAGLLLARLAIRTAAEDPIQRPRQRRQRAGPGHVRRRNRCGRRRRLLHGRRFRHGRRGRRLRNDGLDGLFFADRFDRRHDRFHFDRLDRGKRLHLTLNFVRAGGRRFGRRGAGPLGLLARQRRLVVLHRQHGHFAVHNAAGSDVIFAAERTARAAVAAHERLQTGGLLIRQAGQRRPLPRDTCPGADIDQLLVVDLQFFR